MKVFNPRLMAIALVCSVGSVSAPSVAQSPGDQKCGANGFVLAYYNGVWMPTLFRCASGGTGNRDNGGNRDNSSNRDSRRQRDDDRGSQGSLVDGDEKCGPDGYMLRFHKAINQFGTDSWQNTYVHC
ncbi:hypothetical protein [Sphingomonas bacterium]|uniref:hypothetical protein n=1 Tax=Sphingomonas bacterium TaxID=1895847 RepID=UPI00157573BC|nr:hypothetical protein [Sphingomonas bacterium]